MLHYDLDPDTFLPNVHSGGKFTRLSFQPHKHWPRERFQPLHVGGTVGAGLEAQTKRIDGSL